MEISRFQSEIGDLRIKIGRPSVDELERLERHRILVPRLRLRYPDPIERRWFAGGRYGHRPQGKREADGPRWRAAKALEKARHDQGLMALRDIDPLTYEHPLDNPKREWKQFIQRPSRRKFVPWSEYKVRVACKNGGPEWHSQTVVTYYSTWQILLYLECHDMGVRLLGNTTDWDWQSPYPSDWARNISFEPARALQNYQKFERQLDAIIWFTEEDSRNDNYVLRHGYGRRTIEDHEHSEMERRSEELAERCRKRFRVSYPQIIKTIKFLAQRWGDWNNIGCEHHAAAYKDFTARAVAFARYLRDVSREKLLADVGRVTNHFKPTLEVMFVDWASEWREDAERLLLSFDRPGALLPAQFTAMEVNAFLDFIEENDLFEFYWRWRSLNERAFSGDSRLLAGLKSDLQGMALSVEHIVEALLKNHVSHPKPQLYDKFKQIWTKSTDVGKLLNGQEFIQAKSRQHYIDLDWFDSKQGLGESVETAADLAICHAIRGNAHSPIGEQNQLRLERMSIILLRGVMRAFVAARTKWMTTGN